MNFLAHTTPFVCSQIRLTALSLCECKSVICSVLRRVYVGIIYSLISKILKFDWLMQATWKWRAFVNQIRLSKRFVNRFIWANDSRFSIFAGTANESDKYSSWYLFLSLLGQVVYFHEDYYFTIWVIIYSYLHKFFKIGVLKTLHNLQKNTCVGVSF